MVSVRTRDYSVFVCPFCGNVMPTKGGYKHLSTHGVQSSKLSSKLSYTVVMHADEDTVRGLAVLLSAYLTTSGYRLLMGKRVVGVGKHVFATLASLIREKPNVFADVFMQTISLAALTIPLSDSAAIYVFKFGRYMTLYVGYDFATESIAMIEKDGDVLYTKGSNADALAKAVYAVITERREMWRKKWKQRSKAKQGISEVSPPIVMQEQDVIETQPQVGTAASGTLITAVPSHDGNPTDNAGGDGSASTVPSGFDEFEEQLKANPWFTYYQRKAAELDLRDLEKNP